MRYSSKVVGPALASLAIAYGLVLAAQEISSANPTLLQSLQYVTDSAGWGDFSWGRSPSASVASEGRSWLMQKTPVETIQLPTGRPTVSQYFAAIGGGGAPGYNEVALEKNMLYFQRSLVERGFFRGSANLFFANGNSGESTVRYLDEDNQQRFRPPEIPNLSGAANHGNTRGWFEAIAKAEKGCPAFLYFTGHGAYNYDNEDNNWLMLWEETAVSVQEMAGWLDAMPPDRPFVTMMAQCYSGSFANLIYEGGDPSQPIALQSRCGFFATVASRPSVGCTPAVNEADYADYSSSFFAGLTGRDRLGEAVDSADYNQDRKVSYAEAHAFAKVDEETTDWPISTAEAWLQRQLGEDEIEGILAQPIADWRSLARPEQQYVVDAIAQKLNFETNLSYSENQRLLPLPAPDTVDEAYQMRLRMEVLNIASEALIRDNQNPDFISALDQLLTCEAGSWSE
jgi:hypothetical protein